jgi:hypothetical protein
MCVVQIDYYLGLYRSLYIVDKVWQRRYNNRQHEPQPIPGWPFLSDVCSAFFRHATFFGRLFLFPVTIRRRRENFRFETMPTLLVSEQ